MNKKVLFLIIPALLLILISCDETFLDEVPNVFLSAENTFTTQAGLEAGLVPVYRAAHEHIEGKVFVQTGTDIVKYTFNGQEGHRVFGSYSAELNGEFSAVKGWWNRTYESIARINTMLSYITDAEFDSESEKNQILGELYFFRGFWYLDALQTWGDVPLIIEPLKSPRTDFERDPKTKVLEQAILDLENSIPLLGQTPPAKGRISKGAAQHILTNAYLVAEDWEMAEQTATDLIFNSNRSLIKARYGVNKNNPGTPFTDMFIDGNVNIEDGNTEALWVFQYGVRETKDIVRTGTFKAGWWPVYEKFPGLKLSMDNYQRGKWRVCMSDFWLNLFEAGDDRNSDFAIKKTWYYNDSTFIKTMKEAGTPLIQWVNNIPLFVKYGDEIKLSKDDPLYAWIYPTPMKFIDIMGTDVTESSTDKEIIYLRLAETYLFLAEAQFKQNKFDDAAETINVLRRRVNASEISASDLTIDFILDERARELGQEENRWFTLVRTGKLLERVKANNDQAASNIQPYHVLMPIPQPEIDRNPDSKNFKQNDGYPSSAN
ncbi:MAG: RagB/SusD family nutrient uptake outer membrane protein [Bacteroidales bacterium]|nr:RagB/SusD family nutrient uptake outer membrane protein [Bacteroidales bacterium]MCF8389936.1 RagB/SusD family nutrient uptake outer membrane protein [Bacteroidales bacterium]